MRTGRIRMRGDVRLRLISMRIDTGLAVEDNDAVGQIRSHDEIVLYNEGSLLCVHDEPELWLMLKS